MNSINRNGGDGAENTSLLFSLQKQFPYQIRKISRIRSDVYKLRTVKGKYVLKGYSSYSRLKLQEDFTATLRKEGFNESYMFVSFNQDPITYDKKYFGCLEYLEPSNQSFSYDTDRERRQSLLLLEKFHQFTGQFVQRYESVLPHYYLVKKWTERKEQFFENEKVISKYLPQKTINEWLNWAEWSLAGIRKYEHDIYEKSPVILHGDVAHHNFLRKKTGELNLIDFDLISIGPKSMDLLQYANRILPIINWNLRELFRYRTLKYGLSKTAYLYALVYPTDLLREWNRLVKEKNYRSRSKVNRLIEQSMEDITLRQQFINEIKKIVN